MTRKCHWCGETKNLKSAWCEGFGSGYINCNLESGFHDTSVCHTCWYETLGCSDCEIVIGDCIKEKEWSCGNRENNIFVDKNWNELDYHYKSKKSITVSQEKN